MTHTIRFLIISLLFLTIVSCSAQNEKINEDIIEAPSSEPIKYLALGDSYTIGQGVEEDQRWPNQLAKELTASELNVEAVDIIAKTGWTTRNLIDAIANTNLQRYNLVSLLIGVNNQYQNLSFDEFKTEFDELLSTSIDIAEDKDRVFVVSIPDYGVTPFGMANSEKIKLELDNYNAYMATQCENKSIPFINITEISRALGNSDGALASDNLHPSGSQYAAWTEAILPIVNEILDR